jgi:imidazolonepropionase-like amidohydrolase
MIKRSLALSACVLFLTRPTLSGQSADQFVRPLSPVVALAHVRVIDGLGGPGKDDQTITIEGGRISAVGDAADVKIPPGASTLDLHGRTVIPGLVGMHDHLFYQVEAKGSTTGVLAQRSFAKLYLASGVTTIRTAGTVDFDGDARIKRQIDAGQEPGPKIHLTGTYLNATTTEPDPEGIAKQVARDADRGATSFKAYTTLRYSELKAAITAAHERGLTITGHLCAVGFREAAALGIDNLEHGIAFDSEFDSTKRPDECPDQWAVFGALLHKDPSDSDIQRTIDTLVRHGVAVTSTLAVIESYAMDESEIDRRVPVLIAPGLQEAFQAARNRRKDREKAGQSWWGGVLEHEMAFERAFARAGGKLLAGADPTGWGAVVAGYGDQRGLGLLVAAGFSPEQAIAIATSNGARFLKDRTIGSIAEGLQADLVVLQGNPSRQMSDVRNVELVFKDGVAYDPERLVAATAGTLGESTLRTSVFTWPVIIVLALLGGRRATRMLRRQRSRDVPSSGRAAESIVPSQNTGARY